MVNAEREGAMLLALTHTHPPKGSQAGKGGITLAKLVHLLKVAGAEASVRSLSHDTPLSAAVALQGPESLDILTYLIEECEADINVPLKGELLLFNMTILASQFGYPIEITMSLS